MKRFRPKEYIRLFSDPGWTRLSLAIRAQRVLDFAAAYDARDADGYCLVVCRRRGLRSTFVRDHWQIVATHGQVAGRAGRGFAAHGSPATPDRLCRVPVLARVLGFLLPQRYDLTSSQGERIAQYRQRCNPFVYTLDVACDEPTSSPLDAWLLVA